MQSSFFPLTFLGKKNFTDKANDRIIFAYTHLCACMLPLIWLKKKVPYNKLPSQKRDGHATPQNNLPQIFPIFSNLGQYATTDVITAFIQNKIGGKLGYQFNVVFLFKFVYKICVFFVSVRGQLSHVEQDMFEELLLQQKNIVLPCSAISSYMILIYHVINTDLS